MRTVTWLLAIIWLSLAGDVAAQAREPKAISAVSKVARVPSYGLNEVSIGLGIVGGYLRNMETMGVQATRMALRAAETGGIWDLYKWYILAAVGALIAQAFIIAVLAVEHRRRQRAELEVRRHLQEAQTQLVTMSHLDRRAVMGEVTAAITHELNQPIEAILHNAEAAEMMIESGSFSIDEVRQILADIRRIDTRAGDIIHRMRGLLSKHELESQVLDVNEFARDTVSLVMPVASSKGVKVDVALMNDIAHITGDRVHLQQVLMNLLLNGIDAMGTIPRDVRRLLVQTQRTDAQVEISVMDAGQGIPADAVSRIFDPFYTTKGKGMGIGLSIARTIVEAHGGRIAARNNPAGGATVWFTLPPLKTGSDPIRLVPSRHAV